MMSFNSTGIKIKSSPSATTTSNKSNKPNDESNNKSSSNIKVASSISEKLKKFSSSSSTNDSSKSSSIISKSNSTNGRENNSKAATTTHKTATTTPTNSSTSNSVSPNLTTIQNKTNKDFVQSISNDLNNSDHTLKDTNNLSVSPTLIGEEEDTNSFASSSMTNSSANPLNTSGSDVEDISSYKRKLAEAQYMNKQLKIENDTLHEELMDIRHEMEELQDQFRLDDADEFRQLQAELEIAAKNCRILQFKLRKVERRNEALENEKLLIQDKFDELSRDASRVIELEEELLVAKEVSIRLHGELEQAQEWRVTAEKLNRELKKQLDDLKDFIDNEIKCKNSTEEYNELILVNKLYESMFREYFLQEQLYSTANNSQSQNVTKQLRELTDLLNSYQQKISIFNEETDLLKNQLSNKDKELDQLKLQLKNLKRSKSSESSDRNRKKMNNNNNNSNSKSVDIPSIDDDSAENFSVSSKNDSSNNLDKSKRSLSADMSAETLARQIEIGNDEIKLLRNKIARLEDDLLLVTQERDAYSSQLDRMEQKAIKTFTTMLENEQEDKSSNNLNEFDVDNVVIKQINDLKKRIDQLTNEVRQHEENKTKLEEEIFKLKKQLNTYIVNKDNNNDVEEVSSNLQKDSLEKKKDYNTDLETIKNLTDADKLLRDEYKIVKSELETKTELIKKMQVDLAQNEKSLNEMKKLIEFKENNLTEVSKKEANLSEKLTDANRTIDNLAKQILDYEKKIGEIRKDFDVKLKSTNEITEENAKLNTKLNDLNSQLQEKISELEFLNRENNALQERINVDDNKIKSLDRELLKLKFKIDDLYNDLEKKNDELDRIEKTFKNKEIELGSEKERLQTQEVFIKNKQEEFESNKADLANLRVRYADLAITSDEKIRGLNSDVEKIKTEKEKIQKELSDLHAKHNLCSTQKIEHEIDHEKVVMQKLENQALNAKYETKIQYLEVEIDTLRSKIRKLLKEKELQDQALKESQQLVKEIALKYATDSDAWNRQRDKLLEKEKLYEESVDMRKELKKAADKLRQKLQSLEDQIIEKQNKHTIEKNNWETQRIQYLASNNKLEEQLSRLSTVKRAKKEIEFAWDKERKEYLAHITNLELFVKDLQSQLAQRNICLAQLGDVYGQNERIQSLTGENEFLKNRIKELEIMLEEMEQVKRFLFDVKEAYDIDRHEWIMAKEEFRAQLEIKENLWLDCSMRLNEIVHVIRAIQSNEQVPGMLMNNNSKDSNGLNNIYEETNNSLLNTADKYESLNNLVGGTSNLLEMKLGLKSHPSHKKSSTTSLQSFHYQTSTESSSLLSPSKMNLATNLKTIDELNQNVSDDLQLIDVTKDRRELEAEFDQAFKRMNRVKDNYSTHKKFMDIVKSKSMKALNRKSSATSLQNHDGAGNNDSVRGSVPPNHKDYGTTPRAKSVSKEPGIRDNLKQASTSGLTSSTSSVFSSLSRRIAKIRFSSSSQPPPPIKPPVLDNTSQDYDNISEQSASNSINNMKKSKSQIIPQVQVNDSDSIENIKNNNEETDKKNKSLRERALSPTKFLRSLRPRSPFGRSSRSTKSITPTITTTMVPGGKSFTISNNSSSSFDSPDTFNRSKILQNESYQSESFNSQGSDTSLINTNSRYVRATTSTGPSLLNVNNLLAGNTNEKLKSLSCEFIDNDISSTKLYGGSNMFKKLSETLDEYDETDNNSIITGSSSYNANNNNSLSVNKKESSQQPSPSLTPTFQNKSGSNSVSSSNKKLNLVGIVGMSRVEQLKKNFLDNSNISNSSSGSNNNAEVVKSVKFKDPPEKTTTTTISDTMSNNDRPPKVANGSNNSGITSNLSSTFNFRNKFSTGKSKTIDLPDQQINSQANNSGGQSIKSSATTNNINNNTSSSNNYLSPTSAKPLQSILRRSETPPSSKVNLRQQNSIESTESTQHNHRETSIEKMLRSTSTSRPLMFNN